MFYGNCFHLLVVFKQFVTACFLIAQQATIEIVQRDRCILSE